jgi:hypothetical protein
MTQYQRSLVLMQAEDEQLLRWCGETVSALLRARDERDEPLANMIAEDLAELRGELNLRGLPTPLA